MASYPGNLSGGLPGPPIPPSHSSHPTQLSHLEPAPNECSRRGRGGCCEYDANGQVVPTDEWGHPRPKMLTVDLTCDVTAPHPAAALEHIVLAGQQSSDTSLRLRTPTACPTLLPPPPCITTAGSSAASGGSSLVGGTYALAWLPAVALLGTCISLLALLVGFTPLNLQSMRPLRSSWRPSPVWQGETAEFMPTPDRGHSHRGSHGGSLEPYRPM